MDSIKQVIMSNVALGERISATRGWPVSLARIHGANQHASGFSKDFVRWCEQNGYGKAAFLEAGRTGFGGFTKAEHGRRTRPPVIIVPGNGCDASFAAPLIEELLRQGYAPHDIYALTYNRADPNKAAFETHSPTYVRDVRQFCEAVSKYCGSAPHVIGHSMGVTMAQLAIHGVTVDNAGAVATFAPKLPVRTFIGVAGANQGLEACRSLPFVPAANHANGFHPDAQIYQTLSTLPKVARHVYSVVARDDELLHDHLDTAKVNHQDGEIILDKGGHLGPLVRPQQIAGLLRSETGLTSHDTFERARTPMLDPVTRLACVLGEAVNATFQHMLRATHGPDALIHAGAAIATFTYGVAEAQRVPATSLQAFSNLFVMSAGATAIH